MAVWINAEVAVPTKGYLCLVYCKQTDTRTGSNYKIAKYLPQTASSMGIKRWLNCAEPYEVLEDVTHWIPCPAGPEKSEVVDLESLTWLYDGLPAETTELTMD